MAYADRGWAACCDALSVPSSEGLGEGCFAFDRCDLDTERHHNKAARIIQARFRPKIERLLSRKRFLIERVVIGVLGALASNPGFSEGPRAVIAKITSYVEY